MLPQTKQAVESLKEAGLTREQFRARTPWKQSINGYGETTIVVLCSYAQIAPRVPMLAKSFKIVVALLDGVPCDVSLKASDLPGLYKFENGQEIEVSQIEYNGEYQQLSLWETEYNPPSILEKTDERYQLGKAVSNCFNQQSGFD